MCARESCDTTIVDIGSVDKEGETSCHKACKDFEAWQSKNNLPVGRKCGPNYKLNFTTENGLTYKTNKAERSCWGLSTLHGIETDVQRYQQWYYKINSNCDHKSQFCEYSHGLCGEFPEGFCEGILEKSPNSCERLRPAKYDWSCMAGTGHIWIGPDLGVQCNEFSPPEAGLGTNLYQNCTFNRGQTIYVWTELDVWDEWTSQHYCPELILCSPS
jgi:hypothetical protein